MNPLVVPSWVKDHLGSANLVILDATLPPGGGAAFDAHASYLAEHLPGALYFDIEGLSDSATPLPHMLPPAETFGREMSKLGVGDGMTIVVYERGDVFSAPRAWWMLRTFGAQNVHVLHGGLRAWKSENFPTEGGPVHRAAASFRANLNTAAVKDFAQIQQMIDEDSQILDARSAGRFQGTSPEPRPGIRSGHMPGAINVPYTDLTKANHLKPAEEILAVFEARNVNLQKPVTTSCGSGVTAAVLALGLEICGAKEVSLYDGSWAEYARHPEAVIEQTS